MAGPVKLGDVLKTPTVTSISQDVPHCADCGAELPNAPHELRYSRSHVFVCLACTEKERAAKTAAEAKRIQAALAAIRANLPGTLASVGVPLRWREAAFNNCPDLPPDLLERARRWAETPAGMLYLYGPKGSGKSSLAVAILRDVFETGTYHPSACLYIAERDYLNSRKPHYDDYSGQTFPPHDDDFGKVQLLIFDDLGASRLTPWGQGEIAGLLERRHGDDLPTLITSNLDLQAIGEVVDPRVASRLAEDGQVWQFPARDLRLDGTITMANRKGHHHA